MSGIVRGVARRSREPHQRRLPRGRRERRPVRGVAPQGAVVRLSPLWVSTPVGENLIEKGHDPWEAQQVEHSAAGGRMSRQGHQKVRDHRVEFVGLQCERGNYQDTSLTVAGARPWKAEKMKQSAHRSSLFLDKRRPHTCSAYVLAMPWSL